MPFKVKHGSEYKSGCWSKDTTRSARTVRPSQTTWNLNTDSPTSPIWVAWRRSRDGNQHIEDTMNTRREHCGQRRQLELALFGPSGGGVQTTNTHRNIKLVNFAVLAHLTRDLRTHCGHCIYKQKVITSKSNFLAERGTTRGCLAREPTILPWWSTKYSAKLLLSAVEE